MRRLMIFFAMAVFIGVNSAGAAVIAGTSFENEATGAKYYDTGTAGTSHDLINNTGQAHVDSTASSTAAGDLGFDASFANTRGDLWGMTDGVVVGVSNAAEFVGSYANGSQGYIMRDPDGKMIVTFAPVNLTSYTNVQFSMQLFVNDTNWEIDDIIKITLALTGAGDISVLDTTGSDIDSFQIDGLGWLENNAWLTLSKDIPVAATSATLIVELESEATTEAMCIDNIQFTGVVPEPASIVLMGLGALAVARRKK
jgi:uncharacterized protein